MANDITQYLKWKSYFRAKPIEKNIRQHLGNVYNDNKSHAWNETSKHPRRPWDRYTAPNSKCIGAQHAPPPPPPPPKKKKK